jgi:hypothetical protein
VRRKWKERVIFMTKKMNTNDRVSIISDEHAQLVEKLPKSRFDFTENIMCNLKGP